MLRHGSLLFLCAGLLLSGVNTAPAPALIEEAAAASCRECKLLVNTLHSLWGSDTIENCLGAFIAAVCIGLDVVDHYICEGIAGEFKDEADWVLGQVLVVPQQLCALLIDGCGDFENPINQQWTLAIPDGKPAHVDTPIQFDKPALKVLHLSDLHIDRKYTIGMEAECGQPLCCRPLEDPDEFTGAIADEPTVPAGKWGTATHCDAPTWLFNNMMDNIAATHKDIDYVMVSGDLESHADWDYNQERHQEMVKLTADTIRAAMKQTPVFFAVGNHEGVPIDSFAPHFTPDEYHMDWLYGTMADAWGDWIPADQNETVWYRACYMRKLFPGLRIISLNNGLGDSKNFWLLVNATDPDGTLTWLSNQLQDAEKAGDKVHLVAHIPGADSEMLESWSINYYKLYNRFEDTIVGQFFGHTHSEQFNMYYEDPNDATSRPTGVSYSTPSMTTYAHYWPAYRIYHIEGNYDGSLHRVIDWEEYYLNLTEANASDDDPVWKQLYPSVLEQYGLKDASPAEWSGLIDRMLVDDDLFNKYIFNYHRHEVDPCTGECKNGYLCYARQSHHEGSLCTDINAAQSASAMSNPTQEKLSRRATKSRSIAAKVGQSSVEEMLARINAASKTTSSLIRNNFDDEKCTLKI